MAKKKTVQRGRPPKPKKVPVCSICSGKITPTNVLTRPMLVRYSKLHDLFREQREDPNPLRRFLSGSDRRGWPMLSELVADMTPLRSVY